MYAILVCHFPWIRNPDRYWVKRGNHGPPHYATFSLFSPPWSQTPSICDDCCLVGCFAV
jgi:hypothetical protein